MINDKQIKIQEKKECKLPTVWEVEHIRYGDIALKICGFGNDSFDFMDGDIIQFPNGNQYILCNMEYIEDENDDIIVTMYFADKEYKNEFTMDANDFMNMIDQEDVTIVNSNTRKYKKLM